MRIRRTRGEVVDYVASVSPLGFVVGFTPDATEASEFTPDVCSLVESNYAPHASAGIMTVESEPLPEAAETVIVTTLRLEPGQKQKRAGH